MARKERIDLCVIGGGPAGLAAALEARAQGASVMLIESGQTGGAGYVWGALPAQALAAVAQRAHAVRSAPDLGLGTEEPRVNFARINAHIARATAEAAPDHAPQRLTGMGIELVRAEARFTDPRTLVVGTRPIAARRFIIATGARASVPPIPGLDSVDYFTPETIFQLSRRPSHLIVVGGGATGLALAQAHLRLGSAVTVIDMLEPLSDQDPELAGVALGRLRQEGLVIIPHTGIVAVEPGEAGLAVHLKSGIEESRIEGSHLLFATGRRPNLDALGIEKAGVRIENGRPVLDSAMRTSNRRIFIVGDASGQAGAVHAARAQALRAVGGGRAHLGAVPVLVHTDPAIASVGLTEDEAIRRHRGNVEVVRAPFATTDRARAEARRDGHVKLVLDARGRIVGASVVGAQAGEIIAPLALGIANGLTPRALETLVPPYAAFAEVLAELGRQYGFAHPPTTVERRLGALRRLLP